jgi:hypothetical protein
MMIQGVDVVVRQDKAYSCVAAQTEAGFFIDAEPVFVAVLQSDEVVAMLKKVMAFDHPKVPTPTPEEMHRRKSLIPAAAGVKNWKKLAQGGAAYSIQWRKDGTITLFMSRLDKKGRFEWDQDKTQTFAGDTPLEKMVGAILEDVRSRDEFAICSR